MKLTSLILTFLFFANICSAQLAESLHQAFEIDDFNTVQINLKGEVEVETWAGNTILTETKIKLYDASPGILNYFIKLGRYEIENKTSSQQVNLVSKDIVRRPIKTKNGDCFEEVRIRVFLPEDFEAKSETVWKRKMEGEVTKEPIEEKKDSLEQKMTIEKEIKKELEDNH